MIYASPEAYLAAPHKRVLLFGMSGLGKTHLARLLRQSGGWFHYSVDYRIGTRYMGEAIADNFKREAMKVPLLRELLMGDSVAITSNITFENLAPLSTYLGKPGDPARGGLDFAEYRKRQDQHRVAELAALADTVPFIERAEALYSYPHFICDSGGSICEVVDPFDPNDPLLGLLARNLLMVWIEGSPAHTEALIARFTAAPKPMYYQPAFLKAAWADYRGEKGVAEDQVDPNDFIRWTYARALSHRAPRYRAMAEGWGVTLSADEAARIETAADFDAAIAAALNRRAKGISHAD